MKKGIIQIYTGNGKGKTTAAIGQAVRAAGSGLKVVFFQFLKSGSFETGEEKVLGKTAGIKFVRFNENSPLFDKKMNIEKLKTQVDKDVAEVFTVINSGVFDVVVLDEFIHLIGLKLVKEKTVMDMMAGKPGRVELIMTGRGASKKLKDAAGLVTEMKAVKHPYEGGKGLKARKGIEF